MKSYYPSYYPSYVTSPSHKTFVKVILRMAVVKNLLQIWMPKLVYSLYLTLDNIKNVFFNFHNFDFTAPLRNLRIIRKYVNRT